MRSWVEVAAASTPVAKKAPQSFQFPGSLKLRSAAWYFERRASNDVGEWVGEEGEGLVVETGPAVDRGLADWAMRVPGHVVWSWAWIEQPDSKTAAGTAFDEFGWPDPS